MPISLAMVSPSIGHTAPSGSARPLNVSSSANIAREQFMMESTNAYSVNPLLNNFA
jgi:hypothetical protein